MSAPHDDDEFDVDFGGVAPTSSSNQPQPVADRLSRYAAAAATSSNNGSDNDNRNALSGSLSSSMADTVEVDNIEAAQSQQPGAPVQVHAELSFSQIGEAYKGGGGGAKKPTRRGLMFANHSTTSGERDPDDEVPRELRVASAGTRKSATGGGGGGGALAALQRAKEAKAAKAAAAAASTTSAAPSSTTTSEPVKSVPTIQPTVSVTTNPTVPATTIAAAVPRVSDPVPVGTDAKSRNTLLEALPSIPAPATKTESQPLPKERRQNEIVEVKRDLSSLFEAEAGLGVEGKSSLPASAQPARSAAPATIDDGDDEFGISIDESAAVTKSATAAPTKKTEAAPAKAAPKPDDYVDPEAEAAMKKLGTASLAGRPAKVAPGRDEFDVWEDIDPTQPKRKVLAPSKQQKNREAPVAVPAPVPVKAVAAAPVKQEPQGPGLQASVLAGLLPPTHVLDKYMTGSSTSSSTAPSTSSSDPTPATAAAVVSLGSLDSVSPAASTEPEANLVHVHGEQKSEAKAEDWHSVTALRDQQVAEEKARPVEVKKIIGVQDKSLTNTRDHNISYDEALRFCASQAAPFADKIQIWDDRNIGGGARCLWCLCGKPKLADDKYAIERTHIFSLALMPLDYKYVEHERIVQTIYKSLTGDRLSCPMYGGHWELIGFQGTDPATDCRGSGMLGLILLLGLLKENRPLALRIHKLSRDDRQNFPFAIVSFNITGIVMQVLREGKLYPIMRARKLSVHQMVNLLYVSLFYWFFIQWTQSHLTIMAFDATKKKMDAEARRDPAAIIAFFEKNNKSQATEERLEFTVLP